MRQLEILAPPSQASTIDSTKAALEQISLQNHLFHFEKVYPYGPDEPRYRLLIAAELPGYFHLGEAKEIIEQTDLWRWSEPQALGRLGVLIESALARTAQAGGES